MTHTTPNVYIIESLNFDDEEKDRLEGYRISDTLNQSGIKNKYVYIRTKLELVCFLDDFLKSGFRYLHISCHGNTDTINLTLDDPISFTELSHLLSDKLDLRRLFLSCCQSTNHSLVTKIFSVSECHSIIGFDDDVNTNDAVVFWSSFYHLVFKYNNKKITQKYLTEVLQRLKGLFQIPLVYYTRTPKSKSETFRKVSLP